MLTLRDDAIDAGHPLHRLLGMLATGPVHRLELSAALARRGAWRWPRAPGATADAVHALTRGNPFFVAEALAAPPDEVPASVKDAVLARVRLLSGECREALERLSVLTSTIPTDLADALGALEPLAEAEMAGLIELRAEAGSASGTSWRGARSSSRCRRSAGGCSTSASWPRCAERGRPDRGRLLHHAAEAGDVDTLLAEGPAAAREAARAGSHRQALAHFEAIVPHAARLEPRECAALLDDYGWELYNAHQFRAAVEAAHEAERLYVEVGEPVPLALCLVRLSRHLFMAGATDAAEEAAQRAVATLDGTDDEAALAHATLYLGAILALSRPERGARRCSSARTRWPCARAGPTWRRCA